MAKKKAPKKKGKKRRRSHMSGIKDIPLTNILATVSGALLGKFADKMIPDSVSKKISASGKIALGVLLPMFSKDVKTKAMLSSAGMGLAAVGAVDLFTDMGVLSGTSDEPGNDLFIAMSGDQSVLAGEQSILAGDGGDMSVINGSDIDVINGLNSSVYHDDDDDI